MTKVLQDKGTSAAEADARFTTISGRTIAPVYGPADTRGLDYARDLGDPGQFPYTRGVHATMYRGKLWTMRQFAGFGSAAQTNARFKYLLEHGGDGLSVAFDLPTLMGYDTDHPLSLGEVGKCGVAVSSLRDMETLFDGHPARQGHHLDDDQLAGGDAAGLVHPGGGEAGRRPEALAGTLQNDILKEFIAQKEYIFPPRPSMRIVVDMIRFCTEHMPKWNTISISGYHIREAGSTAAQELAFTLRDGIEYVQWCVDAGMDVDGFAPRLSFFFNSHNDFFEEIAKFRAARRIWARTMRERFHAKNPRSWMLRFHTQTAGVSLTAQQPYNNVVRTALQALAGGAGRHAVAAHQLARRGARAADRGGRHDRAAHAADHRPRVRRREHGRPARRLVLRREADERHRGRGARLLPQDRRDGRHGGGDRARLPAARDPGGGVPLPAGGRAQGEGDRRRQRLRDGGGAASRSSTSTSRSPPSRSRASSRCARAATRPASTRALAALKDAARGTDNLMPPIIEASRAYATVGEMCDALREVFGEYEEQPIF